MNSLLSWDFLGFSGWITLGAWSTLYSTFTQSDDFALIHHISATGSFVQAANQQDLCDLEQTSKTSRIGRRRRQGTNYCSKIMDFIDSSPFSQSYPPRKPLHMLQSNFSEPLRTDTFWVQVTNTTRVWTLWILGGQTQSYWNRIFCIKPADQFQPNWVNPCERGKAWVIQKYKSYLDEDAAMLSPMLSSHHEGWHLVFT